MPLNLLELVSVLCVLLAVAVLLRVLSRGFAPLPPPSHYSASPAHGTPPQSLTRLAASAQPPQGITLLLVLIAFVFLISRAQNSSYTAPAAGHILVVDPAAKRAAPAQPAAEAV